MVVTACAEWDQTRECLESLAPTLRPCDQVIVLADGLASRAGAQFGDYSWLEVVQGESSRESTVGRNGGAAEASGEITVFLGEGALVADGWLDELLSPFADPRVGAVGPRLNDAVGPQLVDDAERRIATCSSREEFAREWGAAHVGRLEETHRLAGACLAVRTELFRSVGGFDEGYATTAYEDDDLCMKLRTKGYRLFVTHGCYVHRSRAGVRADPARAASHDQHRFRVAWGTDRVAPLRLLSVCLIVKDEERMLPACLASVADIADEIIVYDTGSSDRTVEIARSAGARVIEGYWDDSFARARNAALSQAVGEWVFSLDADEVLLADPGSLRAIVGDQRSGVEAYLVSIENLHGAGNARSVHTAIRLFRRAHCTWRHRLHEQVVAVDEASRTLNIGYLSGSRIVHYGYAADVFHEKGKAERNLALARAALDDEGVSKAYALMNYGRALESAGRSTESVTTLYEAAQVAVDPITQRMAVKNLIHILARLQRFDEALAQVDELRRISSSQIAADTAEGVVRISMGDAQLGLSLLDRVPPRGRDDEGMEYAAHTLAAMRGEALASLGRFGEAADVVLATVRTDGVLEADLGELTLWLVKAQRSPSEIAGALDVVDLIPVLGRVLRQPALVADIVLEGIWERFADRLEPLAAAGRLGPRLPIARALVWSSRLRHHGLRAACPLVAIVNDTSHDPHTRLLAAAAAFGAFDEHAVVHAALDAVEHLDPKVRSEALEEVHRIAPGMLEAEHEDIDTPDTPSAGTSERSAARGRSLERAAAPIVVAQSVRRGGVNIVGPFESESFYGETARSIATWLEDSGVAVSTTTYQADGRAGRREWVGRGTDDCPFDTTVLVLSPEDVANFVIDNGAAAFEDRYMIALWTWDLPSSSLVMATSARMVHEIWVPSAFTREVVSRVTDRPVTQMWLPVANDEFCGPATPASSTLRFLASVDFASGTERQNPLGVLRAYCRAFRPDEGPQLTMVTSRADHYLAERARLAALVEGRGDVTFVDGGDDAPQRLFEGCVAHQSCYVELHRSEGTGFMLARAMMSGIVTIATQWSFGAEVHERGDYFGVAYSMGPVSELEHRCLAGAQWAEPDLDAAASAMRAVLEQPQVARTMAARARSNARRRFTPSVSVLAMKERLATIDRLRHRGGVPVG